MISVHGLRFSYPRSNEFVIDGLDATFPVGTVTTITGSSGRGKSTLLYLLGLMLTPSSGEIRYDTIEVGSQHDSERTAIRAHHIGFVFQDALLDPARSIIDNVLEAGVYPGLPRRKLRARVTELVTEFGVQRRQTHLPGEISGGQAQRVALCRALLKSPSIILADEPTGNLDGDTAALVWGTFRQQADNGVTVVVATHDRSRVACSDAHLDLDLQ